MVDLVTCRNDEDLIKNKGYADWLRVKCKTQGPRGRKFNLTSIQGLVHCGLEQVTTPLLLQ